MSGIVNIPLTLDQITEMQKQYGVDRAQELMNSGEIWNFEGSVGRAADDMIEAGILMLPEEETRDYYGTRIPPRNILKDGTKGTLGNSQRFWKLVEEGDEGATEFVEQFNGFMKF